MPSAFKPWPAFSLQTPNVSFIDPSYIGDSDIVIDEKVFLANPTDPLYLIHLVLEKQQLINKKGLFDYQFFGQPHHKEKIAVAQIQRILVIEGIINDFIPLFINNVAVNPNTNQFRQQIELLYYDKSQLKTLLRSLLQGVALHSKAFGLEQKNQILDQADQTAFKTKLKETIAQELGLDNGHLGLTTAFLETLKQTLGPSLSSLLEIKPLEISFSLIWNNQEYFAVPIAKAAALYAIEKLNN